MKKLIIILMFIPLISIGQDQEEIVEEVEVMEEDLELDIPFAIVDEVPLFPGCETIDKWVYNYHLMVDKDEINDDKINRAKRKCFQDQIQKHVIKNFRYPEIAQEMGIQGRVFVQFMIGKDGNISGISTRGPDKNLEDEARRIISLIPKLIKPGMMFNAVFEEYEAVRVPFSIPITFSLN